jgi:flavin-binding protein dodecin
MQLSAGEAQAHPAPARWPMIGNMPVINTLELEGVSPDSWGAAAREALKEAAKTIRNIRRMEVLKTSATISDGNVDEFRTEVRIFFEVEPRTSSGE